MSVAGLVFGDAGGVVVAGLEIAPEGTAGFGDTLEAWAEGVDKTVPKAGAVFLAGGIALAPALVEALTAGAPVAAVPALGGFVVAVALETGTAVVLLAGVAGLSGTWGRRCARISAARVGAGVEAGASCSSLFVMTNTSSRWLSAAAGLTLN